MGRRGLGARNLGFFVSIQPVLGEGVNLSVIGTVGGGRLGRDGGYGGGLGRGIGLGCTSRNGLRAAIVASSARANPKAIGSKSARGAETQLRRAFSK